MHSSDERALPDSVNILSQNDYTTKDAEQQKILKISGRAGQFFKKKMQLRR